MKETCEAVPLTQLHVNVKICAYIYFLFYKASKICLFAGAYILTKIVHMLFMFTYVEILTQ